VNRAAYVAVFSRVSPGIMGEPAGWQRRVQEFVLGQIGDPPARVLEVGCGKGQLARALARVGHSVTAIDPRAPEGPIFRSVGIEEFSDAEPFDHVVASLSLHHVEDLGRALDKVVDSLRPGGTLVVVEFAWDRIDEATAEWALGRLPATPPSGEHSSWLERCWRGRACGGEGGGHDHEITRGRTPQGGPSKGCTTPGGCAPNSKVAS
jgi:SAM-dependent methyltransferase